MSEEDKTMMEKYGITCKPKMIYHYKEHRYDNLQDAINFAKKDTKHNLENDLHTPPEQL